MTPEQVEAVQASFVRIAPAAEEAAALFYRKLFEDSPEVRALFKGDMQVQGRQLMTMLSTVVQGLHKPDIIIPAVRNLAARHMDYGVLPKHYAPVGAALVWTIGQALGDDFTPELQEAWIEAYGLLSGVMIEAGSHAPATAVSA